MAHFKIIFLIGNPLLTSKVNVIINVLDVNEFPPEITVPYESYVCENTRPGQVYYSFLILDVLSIMCGYNHI